MDRAEATVPLVIGAAGMLGSLLSERLEQSFPATIAATRAEIDVEDRFRLEAEIERLRPTVVINCAAFADVDGCEIDRDRAQRVNADGAENVARAAASAGCRVVHVSTDFVFDGRADRPYREEDPTAPLSEYGRSKLEGERRVAAAAEDHLIVRTSWLYGPGRTGFVDAIRCRAREGGILRVVHDQRGTPTYAADLAEALERLLATDRRGIVHFANLGVASRYEMAQAIVEATGARGVRLEPIPTGRAGRVAARPAYSALDTTLYTRLTGHRPRHWREALHDYLGAGGGRVGGA
ncbi:MAG: dTDP-4-dehydrorhamnose reductase [Acidobacteriota bacterium]